MVDDLLSELGFTPTKYVKGRATIADLFKPDERCGVYVLHFLNGEFYTGQAVDVTRRYAQHCSTHTDIEKLSFKPTSPHYLDDIERKTIWQLEKKGLPLRNIVFTSFPKGESDFDFIMPAAEQTRWLSEHDLVYCEGERLIDPDLRRKYRARYEKFSKTRYANEIVDILRTYIKVGVPVARQSEVSFWALSCQQNIGEVFSRTSTGNNATSTGWQAVKVYSRVNVNWQEVLTAFAYEGQLWFSLHIARSPLEKSFGVDLSQLLKKYPEVDNTNHKYIPGGQDQTSFDVPATIAKSFITDTSVIPAIRLLNLRLMKKGVCAYGRFHCMDLADKVLESTSGG